MSEAICISVIIPVARGDLAWQRLLPLLEGQNEVLELRLSVSEDASREEMKLYQAAAASLTKLRICRGTSGRGQQINRGIEGAEGTWVWVLHADSRFEEKLWPHLLASLKNAKDELYYFDLTFADGGRRMLLNSWGVRLRSQLLGMPFGDQGFIFRKSQWLELQGFPENLPYGEDHVFVWRWRQRAWKLRRIPTPIETSARKYTRNGWWNTTLRHGFLTWKQAAPEWCRLCLLRFGRRNRSCTRPKSHHRV